MKIFPFLYKSLPRWLILSVLLMGNIFTSQAAQAAGPCTSNILHGGIITADETWCAGGDNTHYLTDDVTVQAGVTLTIAAGVTVASPEAHWWKYLIVQGHLDINGTPAQPVLLTRSYPSPWGGLFFDGSQGDGSGDINYTTIEETGANICSSCGGYTQTAVLVKDLPAGKQVNLSHSIIRDNVSKGLHVVNSTVNVTDTTFSQNLYPILIDGASSVVTYSGNTFLNNAYPYYDNANYTVQEDAIFINPNALVGQHFSLPAQNGLDAYVLWGNTTIPAGVTMSVDPGVTLRKEGGHFLTVQGHLEAIGTQALPIRFTGIPRLADPAEMGQWGGLFFDGAAGDGSGNLTYTAIERGGNNFMPPGCVGATCAGQNAVFVKDLPTAKQLNIDHSSIEKSLVRGLYIVNSLVNVTNTTFSQNPYPIWIEGADSVVSYSGNNFVDNTYGYPGVNYPMPLDAIVINPDALMGQDFSLPAQSGLDFYVFPSGTRIPFGRTMTVEPGVTLRTASEKYLTVQGHLNAIGTQALPIRFSGIPHHDDLANIFNWGGLFFDGATGDGSGNLIYTTIERGGSNFLPPDCVGTCSTQNAVFVKDLPTTEQLNINHSIIEDSLSKGLYVVNSPTAHVDNNLIKGGRVGAYFVSDLTVSNLALIDQVLYGVYVDAGYKVDARHLTIARAGQIGLYTGGTSQLQNSILSHNALAVHAEGSGQATLDTNLADANTTFKSGTVTELNTINGSAAFEADGYHIQTTSDAVGNGLAGLSVVDIDGDVRPLPAGSLPDLGADEVPAGNDSWPSVVSSVPAGTNPTSADNVDFTVTFSEVVTGVDASDFVLTTTGGVSGATLSGVSGSGSIYTVTTNTGTGNGTIRLDIVDNDTILDASANPLGGVGSGNGDFVAGEEYTITRPTYTLDVNVFGNGSVTLNNEGPYHLNDEVILTATPDLGWSFAEWGGDATGSANQFTVMIDGNKSITATFLQSEYMLTVLTNGSGIVTRDNNGPYHLNDVVTLMAIPDAGWTFTGWTPALTDNQVTITDDTTVTADFTQNEYTLTVISEHGTVTKSPDKPTYHHGEEVTLSVTAAPGWTFTGWTPALTDNKVTIAGDTTVSANFTVLNTAPVAVNDSFSTNEDTSLTIAVPGVLTNDTDADSDQLTAGKVSDPAHGTVVLNSNGSFTYIPASNYSGADTFTYKANDGTVDSNIATVNITILPRFPQNGLLDNFNRANGKLGANWGGSSGIGSYRIVNNQVDVIIGGPLYWKPTVLGVNQEAFVTLTTVGTRAIEQDILLKVQGGSNPSWTKGVIEVWYDARANRGAGAVRVDTYRPNAGFWTHYPDIQVTFNPGDQLLARALSSGKVEIYRNGVLVGTVTMKAADRGFFNNKGGKIGLWFIGAGNAFFDDFGGGNVTP